MGLIIPSTVMLYATFIDKVAISLTQKRRRRKNKRKKTSSGLPFLLGPEGLFLYRLDC
jgi:hypothetical protein